MRAIGDKATTTQIVGALRDLERGLVLCSGEFTLDANVAFSTVAARGFAPNYGVTFDPMTANAAAELYGGTMYVAEADRSKDQIVVTHANNAQTDRKFRFFYFATRSGLA